MANRSGPTFLVVPDVTIEPAGTVITAGGTVVRCHNGEGPSPPPAPAADGPSPPGVQAARTVYIQPRFEFKMECSQNLSKLNVEFVRTWQVHDAEKERKENFEKQKQRDQDLVKATVAALNMEMAAQGNADEPGGTGGTGGSGSGICGTCDGSGRTQASHPPPPPPVESKLQASHHRRKVTGYHPHAAYLSRSRAVSRSRSRGDLGRQPLPKALPKRLLGSLRSERSLDKQISNSSADTQPGFAHRSGFNRAGCEASIIDVPAADTQEFGAGAGTQEYVAAIMDGATGTQSSGAGAGTQDSLDGVSLAFDGADTALMVPNLHDALTAAKAGTGKNGAAKAHRDWKLKSDSRVFDDISDAAAEIGSD